MLWIQQLKTRFRLDLFAQFPGPVDMVLHFLPDPFHTVIPDHKPEFEGSEPSAQLHTPVTVILDSPACRGLQIFRKDLKGPDKGLCVLYKIS